MVSYLSLSWLTDTPNSHRYQVESATLLFVVVGTAVRLTAHAVDDQPGRTWFGFGRSPMKWSGQPLNLQSTSPDRVRK